MFLTAGFGFRALKTLAYGQQRLTFARKPQNSGLQSAGQVELIDVLHDNERIAIHEPADLCPPPFEIFAGNVFG